MPLPRHTPLKMGQQVEWDYPHEDLERGSYVVAADYPPKGGSATYVMVAKEVGGQTYPALHHELTLITNPTHAPAHLQE